MATFVDLYATLLDYELGASDSNVLFLTAKRKAAVNEGLRQFADLTECWVKTSTVTCSNAVAEYNLLSTVNVPGGDFVRLSKQGPTFRHRDASSQWTYQAGDDLPRRDIPWLDAHRPGWQSDTGGTPDVYYEREDGASRYLGLNPPPHLSTADTGNVLVPYVARPSSLVNSTDVPFGGRVDLEPYHQAAVHYAASKMEKLRKDPQASASQLQAFMGYVQRYVLGQRPKHGRTVRAARSYFTDAGARGNAETVEVADT